MSCTIGGTALVLDGTTALVLAASVIATLAVVPAVVATARGVIWSSPVTWTGWAALNLVALWAQVEMGGPALITLTGVLAVGAAAMAVVACWAAATRRAPPRDAPTWQRHVDWWCAIGAASAFTALRFSSAEAAIALTVLTDAIASVPTVVAAWRTPHVQPLWAYFGVAVASALAILAGGPPSRLIEVTYLLYVFTQQAALTGIVLGRQWWLDRPPPAAVYVDPPTVPLRPRWAPGPRDRSSTTEDPHAEHPLPFPAHYW